MSLLIAFIILALLFGVGGAVKGISWFFLIAVVLLLCGVFFGSRDRL